MISISETLSRWNDKNLDVLELWYDWFCKSTSLANKGERLMVRLKAIAKSPKFDNDKTYVFFKNNCPLYGDCHLYDDFRICDIETRNVLYTIVPRSPFGVAEVWGHENNFKGALVKGSWKEIKKWFLEGNNATVIN